MDSTQIYFKYLRDEKYLSNKKKIEENRSMIKSHDDEIKRLRHENLLLTKANKEIRDEEMKKSNRKFQKNIDNTIKFPKSLR